MTISLFHLIAPVVPNQFGLRHRSNLYCVHIFSILERPLKKRPTHFPMFWRMFQWNWLHEILGTKLTPLRAWSHAHSLAHHSKNEQKTNRIIFVQHNWCVKRGRNYHNWWRFERATFWELTHFKLEFWVFGHEINKTNFKWQVNNRYDDSHKARRDRKTLSQKNRN